MRVYGLRSPVKSFGWLVGVICFGMAVLYPSFPGLLLSLSSPAGGSTIAAWAYSFVHVLASGGLVWHIASYLRWQAVVSSPWTSRAMFVEFSPLCFLPAMLPFSVLLSWRWLVTYAASPTIFRGLLSVILAFACSLALVFLLDQVGGRIMLHVLFISFATNLEIRGLMATIWKTAVIQSAFLALPSLAVGGVLAWHQARLGARPRFRPQPSGTGPQND